MLRLDFHLYKQFAWE